MNIFRRHKQSNPKYTNHKMYIFVLRGPDDDIIIPALTPIPVEIYSVHEEMIITEETEYIAPVITVDGHIVLLPIGKIDDLNKMQHEISDEVTKRLNEYNISNISIGNFAVVGTSFHLPNAPNISCNVYRILTYPEPLPELNQIYSYLKVYCEDETARSWIQSYFAQDLQKKWINNVITGLTQKLNWNSLVDDAIKETYKKSDEMKSKM